MKKLTRNRLLELCAQAYCTKRNSEKEVDPRFTRRYC